MCGIVGVFSFKESIADQRSYINWALKRMHHRGPDSNGVWSNDCNYIAGFVRLSIRDLSENGNQPMLSQCGKYAISFNGEIYNTDEFKTRLQDEGIHFRSSTDTEVLLYALINWGAEYVLGHFDGIFAFAFYDHQKNELLLARDRAGIKPLYIGHSEQGVVYSSQYDNIINHDYIRDNALDASSIGAYLALGYVPEGQGAVMGTYLLPHGYFAIVSSSGISQNRYYSFPISTNSPVTKSLEDVLERSVKSQLVSDVPVGTFMSGGVDSPLVSYYANRHTHLQSFTIGVDDASMNESQAAEAYAALIGTTHQCRHITGQDLFETISDNTKAFSEPFADFSSIPTLILSGFARKNVTVALSGDGGDELFWGYARNRRMLLEGAAFRGNKMARLLTYGMEKLIGKNRVIRKRHLQASDFPSYYFRSLFINGAEVWLPQLFKSNVSDPFFLDRLKENPKADSLDNESIMNVVRKLEFDLHLQRILIKVDRASMFHSLEVRVPMLSNEMIDFCTTMHYGDCIRNSQGKFPLKKLLAGKTDENLVFQPKKGFVIPIGNWMRQQLKKDVEEKLLSMPPELSVMFDRKVIAEILGEHNSGKQDWGWLIWSLYSLVNWYAEHRNAR